ncbi:hypothetical protein U2100_15385, partial [Listeria monocytogenes]|uniref:hypothetical protein n=1 Tax=Listeria monocytogenes TaxID=1639 RepID=UPI002FDBDCFF
VPHKHLDSHFTYLPAFDLFEILIDNKQKYLFELKEDEDQLNLTFVIPNEDKIRMYLKILGWEESKYEVNYLKDKDY